MRFADLDDPGCRRFMPGKLLMGTSGFVVDAIGYVNFFLYTATLSLPGLALLGLLHKRGVFAKPTAA